MAGQAAWPLLPPAMRHGLQGGEIARQCLHMTRTACSWRRLDAGWQSANCQRACSRSVAGVFKLTIHQPRISR